VLAGALLLDDIHSRHDPSSFFCRLAGDPGPLYTS
jgi:hypothetical protein